MHRRNEKRRGVPGADKAGAGMTLCEKRELPKGILTGLLEITGQLSEGLSTARLLQALLLKL